MLSLGLLYKHLSVQLAESLSDPFPQTPLRHRHAQTVEGFYSSLKINCFILAKDIKNPDGHTNCNFGSKVSVILLNGWICPC